MGTVEGRSGRGPAVSTLTHQTPVSRWSAALRTGRPLAWSGPLPSGWRPAEVGPLVDEAGADGVRDWLPPGGSEGNGRAVVTVLVPTHRRLPWGLSVLRDQSWPTEVLVVSNGKGPRRVPGARVWRTPWLGHAATRSTALSQVDTPFVLMLSDDAVPRGRGFVEALVAGLQASGADAAVARQVPWPHADATTRQRIRRWTPTSGGPMPHADHVATLYRTAELKSWPRPEVAIAEDLAWTRGRRVVCVAEAPVLHSHERRAEDLFRRMKAEHAVRAALGADLPVPGLRAALRHTPGTLLSAHPREVLNRLAELAGMAVGARSRHVSAVPRDPSLE